MDNTLRGSRSATAKPPLTLTLINSGHHVVAEPNSSTEEYGKQEPAGAALMWVDGIGGAKPNEADHNAGHYSPCAGCSLDQPRLRLQPLAI